MITPTVSVLLPVYNGERFIAEAIQSILHQTYRDFELFIINDCSTDRTAEILDQFDDTRINALHTTERLGLVRSLNTAAEKARGTYLARMDVDDSAYEHRLERQVAFLEKHPDVGVLGTSAVQTDIRGRVISLLGMPEAHASVLWQFFFDVAILHPTVMMRTDVFRRAGGYSPSYTRAEDMELWSRLLFQTRFANLKEVLHQRRLHGRALGGAKSEMHIQATMAIRRKVFSDTIGWNVSDAVLRWFVDPFRPLSHDQRKELLDIFRELPLYMRRTFRPSSEIAASIQEDIDRRTRIARYSDCRVVRKYFFRFLRDILPMTTRHRLRQSAVGGFFARRI